MSIEFVKNFLREPDRDIRLKIDRKTRHKSEVDRRAINDLKSVSLKKLMELPVTKIGGHDCEGITIDLSISLGKDPDAAAQSEKLTGEILKQLRIAIRKRIIEMAFPDNFQNQRLRQSVATFVAKKEITTKTNVSEYLHEMDVKKTLDLSDTDEEKIKAAIIKIQKWMSDDRFSWGSIEDEIQVKTERTYHCRLNLYHPLTDNSKEGGRWSTLDETAKRIFDQGLHHKIKSIFAPLR